MSSSTEQAMLEELRQIRTYLTPKGPEEKKLSSAEIRKTIAVALGAAFGFIIALVWNNVVVGALTTAGYSPAMAKLGDWGGWGINVVISVVITIIMVVLIIVVGRWGNKA
jgi:uncharacterized protein YacL